MDTWLHYREADDTVLCFYYSSSDSKKLLPSGLCSKRDESFVSKNWKDASVSFKLIILDMCMC